MWEASLAVVQSERPTGREQDAAIMERIRARDLEAFEGLYGDYHARLTRFLSRFIRRPQLVEEAINDTLMVVWKRADSFNGDSKLSTWIFSIAYRTAMKTLRRHDEPMEDPDADRREGDELSPEEVLGRSRAYLLLRDAIADLSPDHRAVVEFTYFHDMGYREIADIMGCPVDTVKTRMFHARRHLKRRLAGDLSDWV